jgi:hypothetical protein
MRDFWLWFSTGVEHILDLSGYDHILFVVLLAIGYSFKTWKPLLFMITAFTVGHSISLALSITTQLRFKPELIEFLIALSIFLTAVYSLLSKENKNFRWIYILIVFFGLIHGLGFSFLLKAMLDKEESVVFPLISFNLGLEVGQLLIVLGVLILNFCVVDIKAISFHKYKMMLVGLIGLVALKMCVERMIVFF